LSTNPTPRFLVLFLSLACGALPLGCEVILGIEDRQVATTTGLEVPMTDAETTEVGVPIVEAAAPRDGAAPREADAPTMACFDAVTRVDEFSSATTFEWSVRFTSDGLGVYLTRGKLIPDDLRAATITYAERSSIGAPFGSFSPVNFDRTDVPTLNAHEANGGLSVLFDTYDHPDPCPRCRHIWRASRSSTANAWGPATKIVASPENEDYEPYVVGSVAYYVSARDPEPTKIWRASFANGSLVTSDQLGKNWDGVHRAPVATVDHQTLFFARLPLNAGSAPYTIWVTSRARADMPFGTPQPVVFREPYLPPNAAFSAFPTWISPDGCVLYFRADRERENDMDIYRATRCSCLGGTVW